MDQLSNPNYPARILQFGTGNFLRAFVDWMVEVMNQETDFQTSIIVVKSTPSVNSTYLNLKSQEGTFHLQTQGIEKGTIIDRTTKVQCISKVVHACETFEDYLELAHHPDLRFVVSNTTEAGIAFKEEDLFGDRPASSFPGKLTQLLFRRYQNFNGAVDRGFVFLPCELIKNNGLQLRMSILKYSKAWKLGKDFESWIDIANTFCNTLVDRIVPGFPHQYASEIHKRIQFQDRLLVSAEAYHLWVIEGPDSLKGSFPIHKTKLNVHFVKDLSPWRTQKVRILNGAHTAMVPVGILRNLSTVGEVMNNKKASTFIEKAILKEIIPSMDRARKEELKQYAAATFDRFRNPFLRHYLMDISLNSITKFRVRVLPSILAYYDHFDKLPKRLVLAFAALIRFYKGSWKGKVIQLKDQPEVLDFFQAVWQMDSYPKMVKKILKNDQLWGQRLNKIKGLNALLVKYLELIEEHQSIPLKDV